MSLEKLERLAFEEVPHLEESVSKLFGRNSVLSPKSVEVAWDFADLIKSHHVLTYAHSLRTSLKTFQILEFIRIRASAGDLGIFIPEELAARPSKLPRAGLWGSLLHDVGKTKIPKDILNKAYIGEGYSVADHNIMKQHPKMGYDLLTENQDTELLMTAWIALTHHRHQVDPYPNELPPRPRDFGLFTHTLMEFTSRVVAIADRYDSLQRKIRQDGGMNEKEARQYLGRRNPVDGELIEVLYKNKIFQ